MEYYFHSRTFTFFQKANNSFHFRTFTVTATSKIKSRSKVIQSNIDVFMIKTNNVTSHTVKLKCRIIKWWLKSSVYSLKQSLRCNKLYKLFAIFSCLFTISQLSTSNINYQHLISTINISCQLSLLDGLRSPPLKWVTTWDKTHFDEIFTSV